MTALVARQPLHPLSMSSTQRPARRLSARLQEKDTEYAAEYSALPARPPKTSDASRETSNADSIQPQNKRKRKLNHDEEDDGFTFTRTKNKKSKDQVQRPETIIEDDSKSSQRPPEVKPKQNEVSKANETAEQSDNKRRKRMSFSTPKPKPKQTVRRSKRLSAENQDEHETEPRKQEVNADQPKPVSKPTAAFSPQPQQKLDQPQQRDGSPENLPPETGPDHAATKISLPFADTPVIRRNKAMRENKGGKGERRSSLSLRGRRASSLIESGSSNAVPHNQVEVSDFYKHIEADGLPEPRRMRQLLTWCASRFLDQQPMGADFEDSSSISAARVIQEELLKELGSKSELSDWFSREDVAPPPKEIPERPNPKNAQNLEKVTELEEQIKKLQVEKSALEALLQTPAIPKLQMSMSDLDTSLLSEREAEVLGLLKAGNNIPPDIGKRLQAIQTSLRPNIDAFADGVHKISQFRNAAENLAERALTICSEKFAERERNGRKQALQQDDRSPNRDLGSVLRGLSRVDR